MHTQILAKNVLMTTVLIGAVTLLAGSLALAADNWVGSWKLDVAKSKHSSGKMPQSHTIKFEATVDGIKLTTETIDAAGKTTQGSYVSKFDGAEVPWQGNEDADTASPKRIDDNNYVNTWRKGGKVTVMSKIAVSKDGKTLTITQDGKNAKGEAVKNVDIYHRQ